MPARPQRKGWCGDGNVRDARSSSSRSGPAVTAGNGAAGNPPSAMFNRDTERAALGACLVGNLAIVAMARAALPPDAFYAARHRPIWEAVCSLADDGITPEPFSVLQRLKERGREDPADLDLLADLVGAAPAAPAFTAPAYFKDVAGQHRIRALYEAGTRLVQRASSAAEREAWHEAETLASLIEDIQQDLTGLGPGSAPQLRSLLLSSAGLDSIPEPEPLIRGILVMDSLAWLVGPPGAMKSFIALGMACSVATGRHWQIFPVVSRPVLYLVAEGARGIRPRVRAWEKSEGLEPGTAENLWFLPIPVNAQDPRAWGEFCRLVKEMQPGMVVIDTQARVALGWDENSARDMGMFVDRLEKLRQQSGACVLVVHHTGHGEGTHMRGSSSLPGAAQTILRVGAEDDLITLTTDKQKDSEVDDGVLLRIVRIGGSVVLAMTDGPAAADAVPSPMSLKSVRKWAAVWWRTFGTEFESVRTVELAGVVTAGVFHRHREALIREGWMERAGEGRMARYRWKRDPEAED